MTTYQLLTTLFYLTLALLAFGGTYGREGKSQVGAMLLFSWVVSNVLFWLAPVEWRPVVFPVLDVLVALSAAKAGRETHSRMPLAIVALSVLAVCGSAAFSIIGAETIGQVNAYEISLNIIFALQCLITGFWGIADVLGRSIHFDAGTRNMRRRAQPAHHQTNEEGP